MNEEIKQAFAEQNKAVDEKISKLSNTISELAKSVQALAAQPKAEPKEPEQGEPKNEPAPAMDFSAVTDAIKNAIAEGFKAQSFSAHPKEEGKEPERKTVQNLGTEKQLDNHEKTAMELSAEVDKDETLTPAQKWSKQLEIWNTHRDEFEQK